MNYLEEINKGMQLLAKHSKTIFVGQAIKYPGTRVYHQVKNFDDNKKLEMPVAEEFQAGFCLGLALEGYIPICIYPRCNFAILACNQIINHIDKWNLMVPYKNHDKLPKVIIKMVAGPDKPLNPGYQHTANYAYALKCMCKTINVYDLIQTKNVLWTYQYALRTKYSTILIEDGNQY